MNREALIHQKDQNNKLILAIDEFTKVASEQNKYFASVDALKEALKLENEVINTKLKQ